MRQLTYDEWKSAGFYVRKGEKSASKNKEGKPTFRRDQVEDQSEMICDPYSE